MRATTVCLLFPLIVSAGCAGTPSASEPPQSGAAAAATAPAATPADSSAAQEPLREIVGAVVEAIDASSYTYLRLKTDGGDVWVATSPIKLATGDRIVATVDMAMENFHSKTLNRDFAVIYFAPDVRREGEPARPAMAVSHGSDDATAAPAGGQTPAPLPPSVGEPMTPPAGGLSIADVWARRASLAGKSVTVRGKVVKFNGGIMGRNWLHIQDGTGKADEGTHDLTITTDAAAAVGDVITATGTLAVAKDFGAGYAYGVILEGATIVPSRPADPQPGNER